MAGFEKDCPICNKRFTSLLEYTVHLGKDHRDVPPSRLLEFGKEKRINFWD